MMTSETKLGCYTLRPTIGGGLASHRAAFTFLLAALSALIQKCADRHGVIHNQPRRPRSQLGH